MLAGLSSRRYRAGLEHIGPVEAKAVSRSTISRRFVAGTARKLHELMGRDLHNVLDHLPVAERAFIGRKLDKAWKQADAVKAEQELRALAQQLQAAHPGAAASLREGLEETLTVTRLGLSGTLLNTFKSTNPIESMISVARTVTGNVKRWRDGQMILRWTAAGVLEAEKQFRRVKGHRDLLLLRFGLERMLPQKDAASATVA